MIAALLLPAALTALAALLALAATIRAARERIRRIGLARLLYRWFTGLAWHGEPVTDAGWRRPATKALTKTGHASRFHHMPRWQRALWRTGPVAAVLSVLYGLAVNPAATKMGAAAAVAALAAFAGWRVWALARRRKHHRTWLTPLHMALAPAVGIPVANSPSSWLQVEPDRSRATLALPQAFAGDPRAKEQITRTVAAKLGLEQPEIAWKLAGPSPGVTFTRSQPPPPDVKLHHVQKALDAAGPDELVLGAGKKQAPVTASLASDSPHICLSVGSGGGKSVTGRLIGAQILHKGGLVAVLDYKMTSHAWARGLPNVAYADTIERIHRLLLWLEYEMERRNEVACAATDIEGEIHASVGPRLFVIAEEMNATMTQLRRYWARARAEDRSLPTRSPAVDAFESLLFMGRQARMNMLAIAQMLSAKASGSGEARENMGTRILGRATVNNWRVLAPEHPYPGKTTTPGRVYVVTGAVRETQVAQISGAQARQMALTGTVAALPDSMPCTDHKPVRSTVSTDHPRTAISGPDQEISIMNGSPVTNSGGGAVSLSEAISAGVIVGTVKSLRTIRHHDDAFPEPVAQRGKAYLYDPVDLASWQAGRRP